MSFGQQLKLTVMLSLRNARAIVEHSHAIYRRVDGGTARSRRLGSDRTCVDKPLALLGHLFGRHYGIFGTGRPQGRSQGRRSRTQRAATSHNRVPHIQLRRDGHRHCHRPSLPRWLGGNDDITPQASLYFLVFVSALPLLTLNYLAGGMLRCVGNMKVPSALNILMCVMDCLFNFLLIFPSHHLNLHGIDITIPVPDSECSAPH